MAGEEGIPYNFRGVYYVPLWYGTQIYGTSRTLVFRRGFACPPTLAGEEGIEPSLSVLETDVLPLNYSPIKGVQRRAGRPLLCHLTKLPSITTSYEQRATCLLRFLMQRMLLAPFAEFFQFQTHFHQFFISKSMIVNAMALGAF